MIKLKNVVKEFDKFTAVDGITLEIPEGETCVLVGPSGCGKTTTLKMINRLYEPTAGEIYVEGENIRNVDPVELRRNIGYVIQRIGLFPHRTIKDNIATTPRLKKWQEREIENRVDELLEMVGMDPERVKSMYPAQLSGGQQQRVGLARAMAADPDLMLMDEPFAAVDPITRDHLQNMFLKIQRKMAKTIVFVTHDINEAMKLGDRVAILREGSLIQYDFPKNILAEPKNQFVKDFVGSDRALKILNLFQVEDLMLSDPPVLNLNDDYEQNLSNADPNTVFIVFEGKKAAGWIKAQEAQRVNDIGEVINPLAGAVEITASVKEAVAKMMQKGIDAVQVIEEGRFRGFLTMYYIREYVKDICKVDRVDKEMAEVDLNL